MRQRPAARILVIDPNDRALLFRFRFPVKHETHEFWATPGGAVDAGESFQAAAQRELLEETGLTLPVSGEIHQRLATFVMHDGEQVEADERYFVVRTMAAEFDPDGWSDLERRIMVESRWWGISDLLATADTVFPENLSEILAKALKAGKA